MNLKTLALALLISLILWTAIILSGKYIEQQIRKALLMNLKIEYNLKPQGVES